MIDICDILFNFRIDRWTARMPILPAAVSRSLVLVKKKKVG